MSDALLEGESLVRLREADAPLRVALDRLEAADMAMRAAKCSTEQHRQVTNCAEWIRMVRMRVERVAQKIAEGQP